MDSEKIVNIWNSEFPNCQLTVANLSNPMAMMGAYFEVLASLGIDKDALMTIPPEDLREDCPVYYIDLVPVINMTRVINHLLAVPQQDTSKGIPYPLTITHLLQGGANLSRSLLISLVNLIAFHENRLRAIAPMTEELFQQKNVLKALKDQKDRLIQQLNLRAQEKAKRGDRLLKIDHDIKKYEEDLKLEKEAHSDELLQLEELQENVRQMNMLIEQKKSQRDALLAKIANDKALRVYDSEKIITELERAAQNVQDAEEKLASLKNTIQLKEASLKNLQKIKPNLDLCINLLNELWKTQENYKKMEEGDVDEDRERLEVETHSAELAELQRQLAEVKAARAELAARRTANQDQRNRARQRAESALREAEERDKRMAEETKKSLQTIEGIKTQTIDMERHKNTQLQELDKIKQDFENKMRNLNQSFVSIIEENVDELRKTLNK